MKQDSIWRQRIVGVHTSTVILGLAFLAVLVTYILFTDTELFVKVQPGFKSLGLSVQSVNAQTLCSSGNHSSVEHCSMNGIDVIRINLNDPNITVKPVIAPSGGLASLTSLAGAQGIAAINGDYRLGSCTNGVYCGEGLAYVGGQNYTKGPPDTYNYRRSLAFNQSLDPHIGFASEQNGYLWNVIGGGPRFTDNGTFNWRCGNGTQNQDCPNQSGTVVINDEYFGSSATNWWNRPQSAIGFSADGNTLYFAASAGNVTMQQLHDVLWQLGSRNNLKLDGGSARSLYYNDGSANYVYLGQGITEPSAWVIVPNNSLSTPTPVTPTPPSTWAYQLFDLGDFNGEKLESNQTYNDLATINKNDWAESLKVNAGYGILACTDANFHGLCARATGPAQFADLNTLAQGLRSALSSIQVCPGSCPDPTPTPGSPPGLPVLVSPADGASFSTDSDITLTWNPVNGANEYAVELWGPVSQQPGRQPGTSFHVGQLPTGVYTWKVEAYNAFGWSGWSQRTFTVNAPTPVPTPAPPVLLYPASGAVLSTNDDITLQWNSVPNAVEYAAELWGPVTLQPGRQPGTSLHVGRLPIGAYTWKVEAYNAVGAWSGWSERAFTVVAAQPTPTPTYTSMPPTPTKTPTPLTPTPTTAADVIFADSFESGNFSAWSFAYTNGGRLSVSTNAARAGSKGAQANIDSTHPVYLADDRPNAEPHYRARFYFHPNSLTMANNDAHDIFYGVQGGATVVLRVELQKSSSNYRLRAALLNDSSTWTTSSWFTISNAWHAIEVDWLASTTTTAKNGSLTFWIDGTQKAKLTNVDNDTRRIDGIWLGPIQGIDSGTRGTYYFDAFESRRQTYIGLAANFVANLASDTATVSDTISAETNVPTGLISTTMQTAAESILSRDVDGLAVKLSFPANPINEPATGILAARDNNMRPDGYTLLGGMFEIQLQGANGALVKTIGQPFTLVLDYGSVIDSVASPSDLSLQTWNSETESWEIVPSTMNAADHIVTAVISRPATFALFQKEAAQRYQLYLPVVQH